MYWICVSFTKQAAVGVTDNVLFKWSNTGQASGLWLSKDCLVPHRQPTTTCGAAVTPRRPFSQQTAHWRERERSGTHHNKENLLTKPLTRWVCHNNHNKKVPFGTADLDTMAGHSALSAWCQHTERCPGRGESSSSGRAHMKLSRSSMGSRAHKLRRESWCTPECRSRTHCRRRKRKSLTALSVYLQAQTETFASSSHQVLQSMVSSSLGMNSSVPLPDGIPQRHSVTGTQWPSCNNCPSGHRQPENKDTIKTRETMKKKRSCCPRQRSKVTWVTGSLKTLHMLP